MYLSLYDPDKEVPNIEEEIKRYVMAAEKERGQAPYISALLKDTNTIITRVVDGHVGDETRVSTNDILIRVHYQGGAIGSAIAQTTAPRQLHQAIAIAEHEAYLGLQRKDGIHMKHPKKQMRTVVPLDINSFHTLEYSDLATRLGKCEEIIAKTRGIISSKSLLQMEVGRRIFVDSLGRLVIQDFGMLNVHLGASARAADLHDGRLDLEDRIGRFGTTIDLKEIFEESMNAAGSLAKRAVQFAQAGAKVKTIRQEKEHIFELKSGKYDIVMDGAMAACTMHELGAGHLAEADRFLKKERTAVPFVLGQNVGVRALNLVDDPLMTFNGIRPPSYYEFDDEGVSGGRTYIVKDGKVKTYLTSRASAGTLSKRIIYKVLTGNARVGDIAGEDPNLPEPVQPESRMSTLSILPNPRGQGLDDMLRRIAGKGLYVCTSIGKGEVPFETTQGNLEIKEAYFVDLVDDKIRLNPVRIRGHELYLIDNVVSFMSKIRSIGNKSTIKYESADCQSDSGVIPQSCGGAAIYVKGANILAIKQPHAYVGPLVPPPSRIKP